MKIFKSLTGCFLLVTLTIGLSMIRPFQAAPTFANPHQDRPPDIISDEFFWPQFWTATAETTGGASYTVTYQETGGLADSPFRFLSHRLPPVTGSDLAVITVTHLYLGDRYNPAVQGAISTIDYSEAGIILSFPFAEAFSTTQPAMSQGGRIFRSPEFIRFIAQNSSHDWETKSLLQLSAADFVAVDGSGDHPDFSASGGFIQFGFTRTNSRSSTLPPVPGNEDLVIDQGVDNWQITIHHPGGDPDNLAPLAVEDVFILDGYRRSLPLLEIFDVVDNDSDPNQDSLRITDVAEPLYGTAEVLASHLIAYMLDEARGADSFSYTISDGALISSAPVDLYIDCACTVLCLNQLAPPRSSTTASQATEDIDLPLIYRVRDFLLQPTTDGRRYIEMYYKRNPEILVNILSNETLRNEALATVELWQDNLSSLANGDGSAVITQGQVDAMDSFLDHLSAISSEGLQQLIAAERQRLGPLDDFAGMTMEEAKSQVIGEATLYLPLALR